MTIEISFIPLFINLSGDIADVVRQILQDDDLLAHSVLGIFSLWERMPSRRILSELISWSSFWTSSSSSSVRSIGSQQKVSMYCLSSMSVVVVVGLVVGFLLSRRGRRGFG